MDPRSHFKWNVNELLSLQREYELLEMSVQEIAVKHGRSVPAILSRLQLEGMISSWPEANGFSEWSTSKDLEVVPSQDLSDEICSVCGDDMDPLDLRMCNLEDSVSDIRDMIKQMVTTFMTEKKTKKLQPLRKVAASKY